jgi:GT2 family glycosyltransferase
MRMPKKVAAVIVNWNNYDDLDRCLRSFAVLRYPVCDVVIVDNGSTDGSTHKIQTQFPRHQYIYNPVNLGYAGGANIGIRYALKQQYDYVWLLNSDTVITQSDYLDVLVAIAESHADCGVIGSLVLNRDESSVVQSEWFTFSPLKGRFLPMQKNAALSAIPQRTVKLRNGEYLNAASTLVKSSVFQRYDLWPEDLFLYFEDNTWEDKIRKDDTTAVYYTAKTYILHKGAASSGGYRKSTTLDYYDTRNYLYFIKRSYPYLLSYHVMRSVVNKVLPKVVRREWKRLQYVLYGFRDFFRGKTGKFEP